MNPSASCTATDSKCAPTPTASASSSGIQERAARRLQPRGEPRRRCRTPSPTSAATRPRRIRSSSTASRCDAPAWIDRSVEPVASTRDRRPIAPKSTVEQAKTAIAAASRAFPGWRDRDPAERATAASQDRRGDPRASLRAGGVAGLRVRQAVARGRRRRRRGDRLLRILRRRKLTASPRRARATCPARRTRTSTSRAASTSSSRRGTSRSRSSAA